MITISRTFSETTPESAEQGDFSDSGFIVHSEQVTFKELVCLMGEHTNPSCSPASGDTSEWYTTHPYTSCYRTGTEREEGIHYGRENPAKNAKYWRLAAKAAGIVK